MWRCLADKFVLLDTRHGSYRLRKIGQLHNSTDFTRLSPTNTPSHTTTYIYTNTNTNTNTVTNATNQHANFRAIGFGRTGFYNSLATIKATNQPPKATTFLCTQRTINTHARFYSENSGPNKKEYIPKIKAIRGHLILEKIKKFFSYFKRFKPLTADQIFAIFSWAVFGTTFWVVVGTTTLLSAILWIVNTLRFQEWVALKAGAYLSTQSGVKISFESAVGDWKHSTIRVHNVILAREGLPETGQSAIYLTIDRMDVNLSLLWMLEGKGILRACKASGVRGFVDRRPEAQFYVNNPNSTPGPRRVRRRGDFEVENLSVSDLLIQLYLPDPNGRPLPVSIYTLECERFRKQWMFLDLLSAKSVVGKFDGCLFTFGIPQKEDLTHARLKHTIQQKPRERELKIDGVPMSLLSKTATGPLGWIKEGTLDISLSITLPAFEASPKHIAHVESKATSNKGPVDHEIETLVETGEMMEIGEVEDEKAKEEEEEDAMELRFDVMFNHLRVAAPLYTPELSYLNNAVVHPILAYMNSHSKHIPLSFDVRVGMSALDGSWTPSDAGLWDGMSASVAMEFGRIVHDTQTTETLRNVANTLLKDCWVWLTGWVSPPTYSPA